MMNFEEARRLAERYVPRLRYDRAEPFELQGVGYTVYTADNIRRADNICRADSACRADGAEVKSVSCKLRFPVEPGETVIEYAFYYDFDIQHLYDLEHVFVRVGPEGSPQGSPERNPESSPEGRISGVLGSFHGKFLNNLLEGETEFEDTHVILYVQPGKHAFIHKPHYFRLFPERDKCCREYAGQDGLLIAPMFEGRISTDEAFDRQVERYIRENYAFTPAWEFSAEYPRLPKAEEKLMPWEELDGLIVRRIAEWKRRILSLSVPQVQT